MIPGHAVAGHAAALMGRAAPQLATGATAVQLPTDEAAHHAPVEWWYFNGHLAGTDAAGHLHCYGFEYVTFQFLGLGPAPLYTSFVEAWDAVDRIATLLDEGGLDAGAAPRPRVT